MFEVFVLVTLIFTISTHAMISYRLKRAVRFNSDIISKHIDKLVEIEERLNNLNESELISLTQSMTKMAHAGAARNEVLKEVSNNLAHLLYRIQVLESIEIERQGTPMPAIN